MNNYQYSIISDRTNKKFTVPTEELPPTIVWQNMSINYKIEKTPHGYKVSHITFVGGYDE